MGKFSYLIFVRYIYVRQENYELIGKWKLGNDLSSDLVCIAVDQNTVYCSMRNGKINTLDRQSYVIKEFLISSSSMWSIKTHGKYLICETVDGKILLLDKATLFVKNLLS